MELSDHDSTVTVRETRYYTDRQVSAAKACILMLFFYIVFFKKYAGCNSKLACNALMPCTSSLKTTTDSKKSVRVKEGSDLVDEFRAKELHNIFVFYC